MTTTGGAPLGSFFFFFFFSQRQSKSRVFFRTWYLFFPLVQSDQQDVTAIMIERIFSSPLAYESHIILSPCLTQNYNIFQGQCEILSRNGTHVLLHPENLGNENQHGFSEPRLRANDDQEQNGNSNDESQAKPFPSNFENNITPCFYYLTGKKNPFLSVISFDPVSDRWT